MIILFTIYNLPFTRRLQFTVHDLRINKNRKRKMENAWKTVNSERLTDSEGVF